MADHYIKIYPVNNGDTTLISLADETKIIVDIKVTNDADKEEDRSRFDVRNDLHEELKKDEEGVPFTDVFILSHPDKDHCHGFEHVFYTGNPSEYSQKDLKNELIRIDELWFSPRIFNEFHKDLSDSAKAFKKEAERRLELHKAKDEDSFKAGNRLRVIGYSDNPDLKDIGDILTVPGSYIDVINDSIKTDFKFFVLGPLKEDTDDNEDRNDASIVLQARFATGGDLTAGLILLGGDSGWEIWERLIGMNEEDSDTLTWDILLAPHHCSWTFFNDCNEEGYKEVKVTSIELLNRKRDGGIVVASCKKILNNGDNPPNYKAKQEYEKVVGTEKDGKFIVTATHGSEKEPVPVVFRITKNGPQKLTNESGHKAKSAAIVKAGNTPKTYG